MKNVLHQTLKLFIGCISTAKKEVGTWKGTESRFDLQWEK